MLLLDQRTLQIKYRVPAAEIYRLSLSPYVDDVAVFHVKAVSKSYKYVHIFRIISRSLVLTNIFTMQTLQNFKSTNIESNLDLNVLSI